jgi:hypothetical protein
VVCRRDPPAPSLACTFSAGRMMRPNWMSCGTTRSTMAIGMLKPTPAEVPADAGFRVGQGGVSAFVSIVVVYVMAMGMLKPTPAAVPAESGWAGRVLL